MRPHETVTVPVTSPRWRPGTRHHTLGPGRQAPGHAGPAVRASRRGVSGYGRARRPETTAGGVPEGSPHTFTPGLAVTA
jgi:hypothetical protein